MKHLTLQIDSNEELQDIIGRTSGYFLVHQFMPQQALHWENADIKINGLTLHNAAVRSLQFDLKTDLAGVLEIIKLNTLNLSIYQFDKPVPDTLVIEYLPEQAREAILKQNGLQHIFYCDFEFLKINSFDEAFLNTINNHPVYSERIITK